MYEVDTFIHTCSITLCNSTRYIQIVDYLLREEQRLWVSTATLQLVSCFGIISLFRMIQLCSHYSLLYEFKVNLFDKSNKLVPVFCYGFLFTGWPFPVFKYALF
jgi:hypothetical protein